MTYSGLTFWRRNLNKIQVLILALGILLASSAIGDVKNDPETRITFIVSNSSAAYAEVVDLIRERLQKYKNRSYLYSTLDANLVQNVQSDFEPNLIITIGSVAAEATMKKKPSVPLLTVLLTNSTFSALATEYYGSVSEAHKSKVSIIFLDQPFSRSLKLSKLLIPNMKTVGVMTGPTTSNKNKIIVNQVAALGIRSNIVTIKITDNPIHKLEPAIRASDVFIPLPDNRKINIATAKWILRLSYRYKIPLIAFSKSYLDAGALAAIYSSVENVAQQTSEFIRDFKVNRDGDSYKPTDFAIEFNRTVAGSLKVKLNKEQFYREKIKEN